MPIHKQSPFVLATCAAFVMAASHAHAQSNELVILQDGAANTARIDQDSGPNPARNSRIAGFSSLSSSVIGFERLRGDTLSLLGPGLSIDTDLPSGLNAADGPTGDGIFLDPLLDASSQIGSGNEIDVFIQGTGQTVAFVQASGANGGFADNRATIDVSGNGVSAGLLQGGSLNEATLQAGGTETFAGIAQIGNGNSGAVSVDGLRSRGALVQIGNNNDSGNIVVDGIETSIVVTQQGNNLTPVQGAPGVSVLTNAPSVTITQTQIGR